MPFLDVEFFLHQRRNEIREAALERVLSNPIMARIRYEEIKQETDKFCLLARERQVCSKMILCPSN